MLGFEREKPEEKSEVRYQRLDERYQRLDIRFQISVLDIRCLFSDIGALISDIRLQSPRLFKIFYSILGSRF
jgi:hypothetical protein